MKKIAFILLFIASLYYWHSNTIENKILDYTEKHCDSFPEQDCVIFLEDVLGINWDTMFLFSEYILDEDVSKEWGIKFNFGMVKDSHRRIVFVHKKKIMYTEEYSTKRSNIQFPYLNSLVVNKNLGVRVKKVDVNLFNINVLGFSQ